MITFTEITCLVAIGAILAIGVVAHAYLTWKTWNEA